mgnify:CR=1 FL=1
MAAKEARARIKINRLLKDAGWRFFANDAGPAISVTSADDAAIYLAEGSTNSVSDASGYADDADANAAIWSDADLTLGGTGSLSVAGNGNDGITSKDDLVVLSGTITVDAADDALVGKDALVIEGGTLKLTAGGDALKSDKDDDETKGWVWVKGGTQARTVVRPATDIEYPLLPGEEASHVKVNYDVPKVIDAPLTAGTKVGSAILTYDGEEIGRVDMVAEAVPEGFSIGSWLVGLLEGPLSWF